MIILHRNCLPVHQSTVSFETFQEAQRDLLWPWFWHCPFTALTLLIRWYVEGLPDCQDVVHKSQRFVFFWIPGLTSNNVWRQMICLHRWPFWCFPVISFPRSSSRHRLSYDDCLEDNRVSYKNSAVLCCILYDSCAQWYAHTYKQFLKVSVG